MYSLIIKILCVLLALYLIGWYVKVYEPELYQQFNAILTGGVSGDAPGTITKHPADGEQHTQPAQPAPETPPQFQSMSWMMTEAMPDESLSMPRTSLALKLGCRVPARACAEEEQLIQAGTYPGLCTVIEKPESENELTAVLCWFAGAGDEIGVFEVGNTLVLRHGEVAEPTAETPGFRGNFVDIAVIR